MYRRISTIKRPYRPDKLKAPEINLKQELFFQHDAEFSIWLDERQRIYGKEASNFYLYYIQFTVSTLNDDYNVYY